MIIVAPTATNKALAANLKKIIHMFNIELHVDIYGMDCCS